MAIPEIKNTDTIFEDMRADAATDEGLQNYDTSRPGGVVRGLFYTAAKGVARAYEALDAILRNAFTSTMDDIEAAEQRAIDQGTKRKPTQRAEGYVRFFRAGTTGNVPINVGKIVGTQEDANGNVLTYTVKTATVLTDGNSEVQVLCSAGQPGKQYNVAQGAINQLLTPIAGIDGVSNDLMPTWQTQIGTDAETLPQLLDRLATRWSGLSTNNTRDRWRDLCLEIIGVEEVNVVDTQPRGRGTTDVVLLATGGILPTAGQLAEAQAKMDAVSSGSDDVLVLAPTFEVVDINVTVTKHPTTGDAAAVKLDVQGAISAMFNPDDVNYPDVATVTLGQDVNLADIVAVARRRANVINVKVATPADDVEIQHTERAQLGTLTVTVNTAVAI